MMSHNDGNGEKKTKVLNLGILGCSRIVPRSIIQPLKGVDAICASGIASRHRDHAVASGTEYVIPHVYDSYQALLDAPDLDFVYIALPNHLHKEWVIKAAQAGKHILVEKPICINTAELGAMQAACRANRVYLLEGLMVRHHPWQDYLKELIRSNRYGKLLSTHSQISFIPKDNFAGNYRSFSAKGGGAFYDLAPYWLQFLQCIGAITQADYEGRSKFQGPNGCDWTFEAELIFAAGCRSGLVASFEMPYQALHELRFATAMIKIDDFFRANLGNFKINIVVEDWKSGRVEKQSFPPQCYYTNQLLFFADVILGRKPNVNMEETADRLCLLEKIYQKARLGPQI
jgi:NDP-hexose-3-ketoreductase